MRLGSSSGFRNGVFVSEQWISSSLRSAWRTRQHCPLAISSVFPRFQISAPTIGWTELIHLTSVRFPPCFEAQKCAICFRAPLSSQFGFWRFLLAETVLRRSSAFYSALCNSFHVIGNWRLPD